MIFETIPLILFLLLAYSSYKDFRNKNYNSIRLSFISISILFFILSLASLALGLAAIAFFPTSISIGIYYFIIFLISNHQNKKNVFSKKLLMFLIFLAILPFFTLINLEAFTSFIVDDIFKIKLDMK